MGIDTELSFPTTAAYQAEDDFPEVEDPISLRSSVSLEPESDEGLLGSTSFFDSEGAANRKQQFDTLSSNTWSWFDKTLQDDSLSQTVRDVVVAPLQFPAAVGLGVLGLGVRAAMVVDDPSSIVRAATNPADTWQGIKSGFNEFLTEGPFQQLQTMTSFAVPEAAALRTGATLTPVATATSSTAGKFAATVVENTKAAISRAGDMLEQGEGLLAKTLPGSKLLVPSFEVRSFVVDPKMKTFSAAEDTSVAFSPSGLKTNAPKINQQRLQAAQDVLTELGGDTSLAYARSNVGGVIQKPGWADLFTEDGLVAAANSAQKAHGSDTRFGNSFNASGMRPDSFLDLLDNFAVEYKTVGAPLTPDRVADVTKRTLGR